MHQAHQLDAPSFRQAAASTPDRSNTVTRAPAIAFFGHDIGDSAIRKRITALRSHGADVTSYTFLRNPKPGQSPPGVNWTNVSLGNTVDGRYLRRLMALASALSRIVTNRRQLRAAEIMHARNIDMLALAMLAKWISAARAKVVYEVLDVRPVFIGSGLTSRLFRWAERWLLARCDMLVVSAPDFVERYFQAVQGYAGPWHLLENKMLPAAASYLDGGPGEVSGDHLRPTCAAGPPWRIGWFGVLKCRRSFEILCQLAAARPDTVKILIRGVPTDAFVPLSDIEQAIARHPNMEFHGRYRHPEDLKRIYADVHFAWTADFLDAGTNSEWCLANRLYEGGYYGAVAIAGEGNATGRFVAHHDLGFVLAEPLEQSAEVFFADLSYERWVDAKQRVRMAPPHLFIDTHDTKSLLDRLADDTCGKSQRK